MKISVLSLGGVAACLAQLLTQNYKQSQLLIILLSLLLIYLHLAKLINFDHDDDVMNMMTMYVDDNQKIY